MTHTKLGLRVVAGWAAVALLVTACGDDDDTASGSASGTEETTSTTGSDGTDDTASGDLTELCAIAEEMFSQDDFPSAEQVTAYAELAPDEIADSVQVAADAVVEADGDVVAMMAAMAEDDVEVAVAEINAFEVENCDIAHDPAETEPPSDEVDESATRVDVTAQDFAFSFDGELAAGPASFVLTNDGEQAHHLILAKVAEGHTIDEALEFEGDPEEAGLIEAGAGGETALAAPGGSDEEVLNTELTPGEWAMLCFLPNEEGTPHAFIGMVTPFTVS